MAILKFREDKITFLGITILKFRKTEKGLRFFFCGIPLFYSKSWILDIKNRVRENKDFDTKFLDDEISSRYSHIQFDSVKKCNDKVAFIVTDVYNSGGHSKCIRDIVCSFYGIYNQAVFFTQFTRAKRNASSLISKLRKNAKVCGISGYEIGYDKQIKFLAEKIINFAPKALLVYTHPDDVFGAAVISIVKRSGVKILFFNHASHFPTLAMNYADVVMECMATSQRITVEKRNIDRCKFVKLQSLAKENVIYYSKDDIYKLRKSIGVKNSTDMVTMSGAGSYKFFETNGTSPYFEMIKRILKRKKTLYHIVMSDINRKQKKIVNNVFKDEPNLRKRLIFIPFTVQYDKYFQCADVFIDSFPVSSALTQIDLMRNKVASVVKINKQIVEYSFHEYQMDNYPYMFDDIQEMEDAILLLLNDPSKRESVVEQNYNYWLNTYERNASRDCYINIIEEECR